MSENTQILPPKLPRRFLKWFCNPQLVEDVEGDLSELFAERASENRFKAKLKYMLDVLMLFRPGIIRNFELKNGLINTSMLKNYLKSSIRNLLKYKSFSSINIFSLSIGMAACMVIFLFVKDEKSFDAFNEKNIYRLCEIQSFPGTNTQKVALSMPGMGPTMTDQFPEIESYTRFRRYGSQLVELDDKNVMVERVVGVDSNFFEMFDYELLFGDRTKVVDGPLDAVVTRDVAMRLFGEVNVVGKTFVMGGDQVAIRGVMENVPENSHLQFNIVLSVFASGAEEEEFNQTFGGNFLNTYFVINENADLGEMARKFPQYLIDNLNRGEEIIESYQLFLQPLEDVHLASTDIEHDYSNHRKFNGQYLDVFILVGIFILIIASVNFTNLTTARASYRSKEVGVRKTIGAVRKQLFDQFIFESVLLAVIALFFAIILVVLALPALNVLIDRQLSIFPFLLDIEFIPIALTITLLLGVVAGLYPSLYLSSFKPVVVLKGLKSQEKKSVFRSSLIILQFSLALGMIVCTLIVVEQLMYIKNKDIGFAKDHIVLIEMNRETQENFVQMKEELLNQSNILGVTASGQRLGNNFHQWGFKVSMDTGMLDLTPSNVHVDYDYLDVYDIELKNGRTFSKEYATDDGLAFIINESFAKELGLENPVGRKAGHAWYPNDSLGSIIGVTEDFNFNSLHYKVNTLAMVVHTEWGFSEMSIKINGQNVEAALAEIDNVYSKFVNDYPLTYEFLDDHFKELYKSDQQMGAVITIIAVLSIFIGCMGLFGLASISIQRRIKEIGIRKVMGASLKELMILLSKGFTMMILVAFVIASPITYVFMSGWLENFAYRIDINPFLFLIGGAAALLIALATVSYHVIRAVRANPVSSLRYE
ncbi:FtsX-like permease family protein [Ekhidna sp. To15]|uniref:FtsX-like permease family protein n=1 Tax=Ekhidna sp. To15 TaxID=3395267 RepID=UPI003F52644C